MFAAWRAAQKDLDKLRRYVGSFERSYYRALTELRRMQTERRKSEPKRPERPPRISVQPHPESCVPSPASSPTGFVSQTAPAPDETTPPQR